MKKGYSYIRFSTPEQSKGDSLRRQLEMSATYAKEHGITMAAESDYRDLGVSAYKGKHREKGALGRFIRDVEAGRVPAGSVLLVESLDRLGRDEVMDQLQEFLRLVQAGITVVTLADQQEYSREKMRGGNIAPLLISLVYMARSNNESAEKSRRIGATWEAKRKSPTKPMTSICPGWLQFDKEAQKFVAIAERVAIVKRIFSLTKRGLGARRVAAKLNEEKVEPWGVGGKKANGWHASYVRKILANRAVLGEYQPHSIRSGKRSPIGEVISGYYPAVIDAPTFNAINAGKLPAGRRGVAVSNLVTGLAYDGDTGAVMHFVRKGTSKRGGNRWDYLVSDSARTSPGTKALRINYRQFEEQLLRFVTAWKDEFVPMNTEQEDTKIEQLQSTLDAVEAKIARLVKRIEDDDNAPASIVSSIKALEKERDDLQEDITKSRMESATKKELPTLFMEAKAKIMQLAESGDVDTRMDVAAELRRVIKRIDIWDHVPTEHNALLDEWPPVAKSPWLARITWAWGKHNFIYQPEGNEEAVLLWS